MNKAFALFLMLILGGGLGYAAGNHDGNSINAVKRGNEICKSHQGPMGFIYAYGDGKGKGRLEFLCNDLNAYNPDGKLSQEAN